MKRIAVFPGSFDPVTAGHEDVIRRGALIFDNVIVALAQNSTKSYMFSQEQRMNWLDQTFSDIDNIETRSYEGLTIEYAKTVGARFLLRGVRNNRDFEYEKTIAQMNRSMNPELETVILFTDPAFAAINSTIVREILKNKGDVKQFLPSAIRQDF